MSLVLDASATLGFIMPDAATPSTQAVFDTIRRSGAWVPAIWRLEIANSLSVAIRRGRISRNFRDDTLDDLLAVEIRVDERTDLSAWGATLALADRHNLTLYDASYLELAARRRLPLATLDSQLKQAAAAEAVPLAL